jgi:hypothetical protein
MPWLFSLLPASCEPATIPTPDEFAAGNRGSNAARLMLRFAARPGKEPSAMRIIHLSYAIAA